MSKKDFKTGINALLGDARTTALEETLSPEARAIIAESRASEKKGPGRPKKETVDNTFFRTTIIAHRVNYEKLKVIAMNEGRYFKDILNDAFTAVIKKYEDSHGEVILRHNHKNPFE